MRQYNLVEVAGTAAAARVERIAATFLMDARAQRGWSQRDLAAASRISQSTISRIESGVMQPPLILLQQLLIAMGKELHCTLVDFDPAGDS